MHRVYYMHTEFVHVAGFKKFTGFNHPAEINNSFNK